MPLTFVPTGRDDVPELVRFLTSVFGLRDDAPFVAKDLVEWKYFAAHPYWDGPRSYLLKHDGKLAAHGCAHPATFLPPGRAVTSTRVIDWAAGSGVPGAGVLLFRKFASLADTLFAVGGSPETQSIFPKSGFGAWVSCRCMHCRFGRSASFCSVRRKTRGRSRGSFVICRGAAFRPRTWNSDFRRCRWSVSTP